MQNLDELYKSTIILKERGDMVSWRKVIKKIYQLEPKNLIYAYEYAESFVTENNPSEGLKILESFPAASTPREEYLFLLVNARLNHASGKNDIAESNYRRLIRKYPEHADTWQEFGRFMDNIGQTIEAENAIKEAYRKSQNNFIIAIECVKLLIKNKKKIEAVETIKKVQITSLNDSQSDELIQLQLRLGLSKEAFSICEAKEFSSKVDLKYRYTWAKVLLASGKLDEYAEVINSMPSCILPGKLLSSTEGVYAWMQCGKSTKANQKLNKLLSNEEYDPRLYFIKAQNLLRSSDYAKGWEHYEHRLVFSQAMHHGIQPNWNGKDLTGQTIIVIGEQGIGDMIFFAHFLNSLKDISRDITLICEEKISNFLSQHYRDIKVISDPQQIKQQGERTTKVAIGSLPLLLHHHGINKKYLFTPNQIKNRHADVKLWKNWLCQQCNNTALITIGLSLEGGNEQDSLTTIPRRAEYKYIFRNVRPDQVQFINIQYQSNFDEIKKAGAHYGHNIVDASDCCQDLNQLSACLEALSFSITTQQTNAHLSGILNLENIVLLPPYCHFAFGLTQSKWYPSLKLIRCKKPGQWDKVESEIKRVVTQSLNKHLK